MLHCVVSHPFDSDGPSNAYEVLRLGDGASLESVSRFEMGRATTGRIVFTPDGRIGLVPQEDGSIGVFRLDDVGRAQVVHEAFRDKFYATSIYVDESGQRAWILDCEWVQHGGGVHAVRIHGDGTLEYEGLWVEGKLPYAMARVATGWLLGGYEILGSGRGFALHRMELGDAPRRMGTAEVFEDGEAIAPGMAVTSDGRYALVGDSNGYGKVPNRIAVVSLEDRFRVVQAFTPIPDPVSMVASPWGGPVLVASGFGNAVFVIDYDPDNAIAPFSFRGELEYVGDAPVLPAGCVCIQRGPHAGRALLSENAGVRVIDFVRSESGVVDRGVCRLATAAGAIGVQPG